MQRITLALLLLTIAAQPGETQNMAVQQKYTRLEASSEDVIKELEEKESEVVSVGLEKRGRNLVVNTEDAPLTVENSDEFSKYAQRIPYEYQLQLQDEDAGAVNVTAQQLTAVKRWHETEFSTKGGLSSLDNAYQQLDESALKVAEADATDADLDDFRYALQDTKSELIVAYKDTAEDDIDAQRQIIQNYQEVERTGKALYGLARDDRYPPEAYQRIYANSRGALAILSGSGDVHCSGVLIADEYALTNEHCVEGFFDSDLKIRFDYEERIDGSTLPTRTLAVAQKLPFTTVQRKGYDFAILKISDDGADGNRAGELYPVQCLSLARVRRNDPIYLIGHPLGNPRTVHDNTFVYFPFRVTELEFTELEMAVRSEFLGADDEAAQLEEFRQSYRVRDVGGVPVYENFSQRWQMQPTIGVDSDTFRGNSGSPAYSRKTHYVVGILFDGEDDLDEPWNVGWRAHEAVLPIEVVVERLDAVHPDWRDWEGVCIDE